MSPINQAQGIVGPKYQARHLKRNTVHWQELLGNHKMEPCIGDIFYTRTE